MILNLDPHPYFVGPDLYGIDVVVDMVVIDGHQLLEGHHGGCFFPEVYHVNISPVGIGHEIRVDVEFGVDGIDAAAAYGNVLAFVVGEFYLIPSSGGAIVEEQPSRFVFIEKAARMAGLNGYQLGQDAAQPDFSVHAQALIGPEQGIGAAIRWGDGNLWFCFMISRESNRVFQARRVADRHRAFSGATATGECDSQETKDEGEADQAHRGELYPNLRDAQEIQKTNIFANHGQQYLHLNSSISSAFSQGRFHPASLPNASVEESASGDRCNDSFAGARHLEGCGLPVLCQLLQDDDTHVQAGRYATDLQVFGDDRKSISGKVFEAGAWRGPGLAESKQSLSVFKIVRQQVSHLLRSACRLRRFPASGKTLRRLRSRASPERGSLSG